jgi:hypothetical protein
LQPVAYHNRPRDGSMRGIRPEARRAMPRPRHRPPSTPESGRYHDIPRFEARDPCFRADLCRAYPSGCSRRWLTPQSAPNWERHRNRGPHLRRNRLPSWRPRHFPLRGQARSAVPRHGYILRRRPKPAHRIERNGRNRAQEAHRQYVDDDSGTTRRQHEGHSDNTAHLTGRRRHDQWSRGRSERFTSIT